MESGVSFSGDPGLERALEQVRSNHEEAEKFAADPEHYLQSKGVDTEGMKFQAAQGDLSDADLELAAGGAAAPTACASVGGGGIIAGCASVGDSPGATEMA
ncbi:MAG: hypothetical protein WAM82_11560 [Thermoanaerobaculia bacterium]